MEISHPRLVEMICVNLSLCLYNTMMIHTICYIQYLIYMSTELWLRTALHPPSCTMEMITWCLLKVPF